MNKREFEKIIISIGLPSGITNDKMEIDLGPDVIRMRGYDQRNPHHCYDLFTHSVVTVSGIKDTAPVLLRVAA